jgi:hypothetical protein
VADWLPDVLDWLRIKALVRAHARGLLGHWEITPPQDTQPPLAQTRVWRWWG